MDSKIPLCSNREENSQYFVDRETNQFYVVYYPPPGKDWSWYFVGFMIAAGSSIAAMHARIDNFYIPRSSALSNGLVLAVLLVAAVVFHFRVKTWARKRIKATRYRPISLENEEKEAFLMRGKWLGCFALVFVMGALIATILFATSFMRTSESRLVVIIGIFLFIFAGLSINIKAMPGEIRFTAKLLKAVRAEMVS